MRIDESLNSTELYALRQWRDFVGSFGCDSWCLRHCDAFRQLCCVCVLLCSFDLLEDWSSSGELFPRSSAPPNFEELSGVLADINSECQPFTRYEVAKRLKELCELQSIRRAFSDTLRSEFVRGLQSMLKDNDEDIVRFGIYTILNFREDLTILKGYVVYCCRPWRIVRCVGTRLFTADFCCAVMTFPVWSCRVCLKRCRKYRRFRGSRRRASSPATSSTPFKPYVRSIVGADPDRWCEGWRLASREEVGGGKPATRNC